MSRLKNNGAEAITSLPEEHEGRVRPVVVDLRRVTKTYESGAGKCIVLDGIDLKLGSGEL